MIDLNAAHLLRRHVTRRAYNLSRFGQGDVCRGQCLHPAVRLGPASSRLGQTEVQNLYILCCVFEAEPRRLLLRILILNSRRPNSRTVGNTELGTWLVVDVKSRLHSLILHAPWRERFSGN